LVVGFVFAGLIMLNGCGKDEPKPTPKDVNDANSEMAMTTETGREIAGTEQTLCPVMDGNKIDKQYFTEYQGKKVYFCCPGCEEKFKAEPEKYIAKLPQFQQQTQ